MPTKLPEPGAQDALFVVDLSGYVYRAYHALPPMSTRAGEPTHAVYGVTRMLLALVKEHRPARLAVALDPKGGSFRKEVYPEYKATRPPMPEDLRPQVARLREVVEAYAIPILLEAGFEADDLIATLVRKARADGLRVVVVSADKDLLQLVEEDGSVVMFDTMKNKVFGVEDVVAKMGVRPGKVRDLLALMGDSSDNVPGVPSVGPKTAVKLLDEYGDLDGVFAGLETIKRKALRAKLTEHEDAARMSQRLVTLRTDAPLEITPEDLRYGGADDARLRALFVELEFHRLVSDLAPPPAAPTAVEVVTDPARLDAWLAAATGRVSLFSLAEGDDWRHAHVVGVALATDGGGGESAGAKVAGAKVAYVPFDHLADGAPAQMPREAVLERLGPFLAEAGGRLVVASSKRESGRLSQLGVTVPMPQFDVMLASYLADPERHGHDLDAVTKAELGRELVGYDALTEKRRGHQLALADVPVDAAAEYAGGRAVALLSLEERLAPRLEADGVDGLLGDVELPLAAVLREMERDGIALDTAELSRLSLDYHAKADALEHRAHEAAGQEFNLKSPRALETILFDELGLSVVKRTKTGRSTDHDVLEQLRAEHPLPGLILEHRALAKLLGTYVDALPRQIDPATGRVHTRFNQAVAATGRMSSSDPNLQNIPIRTEEGRAIRGAFVARGGWTLMSADYSQVELRVLAHLSDDPELKDAFADEADVHSRTASALFDVSEAEVTREQRGAAKTVNYAVIYGQTQFALARNLGVERSEAKRIIDAFFARYAGVAAFMEATVEEARLRGGVRTLLGRWRSLPDIRSKNGGLRSAAERVARNTPIQGTAADLMKVAMVRIAERLVEANLASRMLLTVHDELVFEVAPGEEARLRELAKREMEGAIELDVPLLVDIGVGSSWAGAH